MLSTYQEKISRRLWRYRKALIYAGRKPFKNTQAVFIMGCGRSGTTMLLKIFNRDRQVEALGENDPKIAQNFILQHDKFQKAITDSKTPFLILKPILNSFEASNLLKTYSKSKVLWMVRGFRDMVSSSMKQFGNKVVEYMKNLVLYGKGNNWLTRGIPLETQQIIYKLDSSHFTPHDWMALVWWSVNRTIMVDKLFECDRFIQIEYETLVRNPEVTLKSIYKFIGLPDSKIKTKHIHSVAIGKGRTIALNSNVEKLCQDLENQIIRHTRM